MRTLFHVGLLAVLGAAFLHCSADGAVGPEEGDAGSLTDASASTDADADAAPADAGHDVAVVDAGQCSVDQWCRIPLPADNLQVYGIWSFGVNDAVAATTTRILQWNGTEWKATESPASRSPTNLWASSPTDIWGVTDYARILFHGTRAAAGQPFTWTKTEFGTEEDGSPTIEKIRGLGESDLWAYGEGNDGRVIQHAVVTTERAGDGGDGDGGVPVRTVKSWTPIVIDAPTLRKVSSFWVTANREIWIAGKVASGWSSVGGVLRGVPSAGDPHRYTWEEVLSIPPGGPDGLTSIWAEAGEGPFWTVSSNGASYRGTVMAGNDVQWKDAPTNTRGRMTGIWGSGPNDIWIVGSAGAVRHWDGTKWSVSRLAVDGIPMWQDLYGVTGGPGGDVWAVGSEVILHRAPGGSP